MAGFDKVALNISFRVAVAIVVSSSCFFVLGLRLWYLQIVNGEYFRDKSENNRLRKIYTPPARGLVLDRDGRVLVKNRPAFNVELISEDSPNPEATVKRVAEITGVDEQLLLEGLGAQKKRRPFEPKLLVKDVSRDVVARVMGHLYELPGVVVNVLPAREYVYGDLAAHVLGYIREITKPQLDSPRYPGYRMGDLVGQYGIEARWEKYLQGQRGIQLVVVNATGTRIGESSFDPERPGHNVTTTLDLDLQLAADKALEGKKGAIVALDPRTGEVLALSSSPRFDPNMFTRDITPELWNDLVSGKEKRLNNRAVQGAFPPGSVFKIFTSIATQSEGVMSVSERAHCAGSIQVGRRRFRCHKLSGHGSVDHHEAMVLSCDVYFYTAGQRLGVDRIHEYATRFGLGQPTGLELVEENPGLIPSTAWKKAYFKNPEDQKWYPGETPSVSIGQGAVTTTPLQIARGVAAVINGGNVLKPYLVKKIESADGTFLDDNFGPEIVANADVDPAILKMIIADLVGVVNEPRGTGKRASLLKEFGIQVGGKTGTAQVVGYDSGLSGGHFEDHAWFTGFAPSENPEIVVVALIENGGHGGVAAAPVVKEVMMAHFSKTHERLDQAKAAVAESSVNAPPAEPDSTSGD